jgi:hypothetical protein
MSAIHAKAKHPRPGTASAARSALRVATAVVLLGILTLLVALVSQGTARAQALTPSAPGSLASTQPARSPGGQPAIDQFDAAQQQAVTLLARLPRATSLPQAPNPGDSGSTGDTTPRLAQMMPADQRQLKPRQRPGAPEGVHGEEDGLVLSDALPPVGLLTAAAHTTDPPARTAQLQRAQATSGEASMRNELRARFEQEIDRLAEQARRLNGLRGDLQTKIGSSPSYEAAQQLYPQLEVLDNQFLAAMETLERAPKLLPPHLYPVPTPPPALAPQFQDRAIRLHEQAEQLQQRVDSSPGHEKSWAEIDRLAAEREEHRQAINDLIIENWLLTQESAGQAPQSPPLPDARPFEEPATPTPAPPGPPVPSQPPLQDGIPTPQEPPHWAPQEQAPWGPPQRVVPERPLFTPPPTQEAEAADGDRLAVTTPPPEQHPSPASVTSDPTDPTDGVDVQVDDHQYAGDILDTDVLDSPIDFGGSALGSAAV